jgi:RNase H-fold protein (predicted Holliday junction resolvase)
MITGTTDNPPKNFILGLDVSTKTIGVALFTEDGQLYELTHISPIAKPLPPTKPEEMMKKADLFEKFIGKYVGFPITKIVIEEPLLRSQNVNTVGTLLKFNGIISHICYKQFGVTPVYISTYDARKYGLPELMQPNAKGTIVLFGGYPKDIDKKRVVWERICEMFPNIKWLYGKKGNLQKENFDMSDAACATIGEMRKSGIWGVKNGQLQII